MRGRIRNIRSEYCFQKWGANGFPAFCLSAITPEDLIPPCKICRILQEYAISRQFHHILSDHLHIRKPLYSKGLQHPSAFVPPECAISRQISLVSFQKTQHIVSLHDRSTIFGTTLPEIHTAAVFGVIIQKNHEPDEVWHTGAVLQRGGRNHGGDQNSVGGQP